MKFEEREDEQNWKVTDGKLSIEKAVGYLISLEYEKECTINERGGQTHKEGSKTFLDWCYEKDLLSYVVREKQ